MTRKSIAEQLGWFPDLLAAGRHCTAYTPESTTPSCRTIVVLRTMTGPGEEPERVATPREDTTHHLVRHGAAVPYSFRLQDPPTSN